MKLDDITFILLEAALLVSAVCALVWELLPARTGGIQVQRGNESWQVFLGAWSILSALFSIIATGYYKLQDSGIALTITVLNISLLWLMCFRSTWFRNKVIGTWNRMRKAPENH